MALDASVELSPVERLRNSEAFEDITHEDEELFEPDTGDADERRQVADRFATYKTAKEASIGGSNVESEDENYEACPGTQP